MRQLDVKLTVTVTLDVDTDSDKARLDDSATEAVRAAVAQTLIDAVDYENLEIDVLGHYVARVSVDLPGQGSVGA